MANKNDTNIVIRAEDKTGSAFSSASTNMQKLQAGAAKLNVAFGALGAALSVAGLATFAKSGIGLFGVATGDVAISTPGEFVTEGVIEIAKTSALAISVGDRLYWDATNKCVNKTATAQQCVGIAVAAAANPSASVKMKLGPYVAVAA